MRGRHPSGPEYVDSLAGSARAKERARIILETLSGQCTVQKACELLKVSEGRFQQLRTRLLQAGIDRMEPRAAGRKRRRPSPAEQQVSQLQERLANLEVSLQAAQVREEIALALPRLVHPEPADAAGQSPPGSQKKTRRRRARARAPNPSKPT